VARIFYFSPSTNVRRTGMRLISAISGGRRRGFDRSGDLLGIGAVLVLARLRIETHPDDHPDGSDHQHCESDPRQRHSAALSAQHQHAADHHQDRTDERHAVVAGQPPAAATDIVQTAYHHCQCRQKNEEPVKRRQIARRRRIVGSRPEKQNIEQHRHDHENHIEQREHPVLLAARTSLESHILPNTSQPPFHKLSILS